MEKTLIQRPGTMIYSINFDFTSADQRRILQYLQANGYQLLGYKGATGPNQITSGVPTWFAMNFTEMFGMAEIDCEPQYKVYVFNKEVIQPNTTIQMQALSQEISLGTSLVFHPDGSFTTNGSAPEGTINVRNERPAGTPALTIGIAGKVNGRFQPFCGFTCNAKGEVNMQPNENIVLLAAQSNTYSGSVAGNTTTSGCQFMFSARNIEYDLEIVAGTYGITSSPGAAPVDPVPAGQSLIQLLNK
ncbi:hypothetical protein CLU97_3255 [Chryseobacterium sp. 7]|uniref:hypothetical protein n=1 Tax=Chryseobacterium sp. 7 TaxID=2035214 RepID=UPI000F2747A9|nr:hypothetical protein [Chryseobacterium sp. 7]RLJ33768.1 hypothetical protein CLU97_3255 [Chryseobacterium sp. 7]